jgi:hypothetical protein
MAFFFSILHVSLQCLESATEIVDLVLDVGVKAVFLFQSLVELVHSELSLLDLKFLVLQKSLEFFVLSLGKCDLAFFVGCLVLEALKLEALFLVEFELVLKHLNLLLLHFKFTVN